ncbi:MAG: ABC transporter transmembrane domain-containing protein, partial [Bryobacteraceae bacterium]
MKDLRRALLYFRPDAPRAGGSLCLLLLGVCLNALKPWPLALIVDRVLGHRDLPPLLGAAGRWDKSVLLAVLCATILALHLVHGAVMAAHNYTSIAISLRGLARLRNELFARLQRLSLRFHQGAAAGDLIYRASWDACAVQTLFQQGLMTFAGGVLSLAVLGSVMVQVNPALTFVAGGLVFLLFPIMKFFGGKMRARTADAQRADSGVSTLVQQSLAALPLTQSYTREDLESARFGTHTADALVKRQSQHGWELGYWFAVTTIFALGAAVI